MTQWYRIKEFSSPDTKYISDVMMLPLESIVRVLKLRGEKDGWFDSVTLEAHPELNDLIDDCLYMRYYFGVRLEPIDDLEVFRLHIERTNAGVK